MKVIAFTLATLLCARAAAGDVPRCDKTDAECLLRQSLQQTYDLEAARQSNQLLQKNLDEEIRRADSGPKFFVCGLVAGAVFVGLAATLALKAIHLANK
jgi:hypothetical protein